MNLDNLKDAWKVYAAQAATAHRVTEEEIAGLLKTRTENALTKLRRNIYFEMSMLAFTVLLFGAGAVALDNDVVFRVLCVIILLICLPYLGYFWGRISYLRALNVTTANLRATLQNLIFMLNGLTRLYFWSNLLLGPIGLVTGQLVYLKFANHLDLSHLPWEQLYPRLIIGFLIGAGLGYFFLRWYIKQMFGTHLKCLRGALQELDTLETAA